MNDEKQDDQPVNEVDRVIYDYLDEMLHDPAAEQAAVHVQDPVPALAKVVPDNIAHFDVSKKKFPPLAMVPVKRPALPAPEKKESLPYSVMERPAFLSESLLRISPEAAEPEPAAKDQATPHPEPIADTGSIVAPAPTIDPKPVAKAKPDPVIKPEPPARPEPKKEVHPEPKSEAQVEPEEIELEGMDIQGQTQWCENGRPSWAQSRFECLIFSVNGLKLAVPLITLGSVHQIGRKFNALPGQFDWFLGILQTPSSGNIKVLDTGLCVMPERHDPAARASLAYVITIHGYAWGLACHHVEKSITLEPDQVKWRSQRGKRPWLAGTVVDHMCSLVDTDGFQEIINKAEQSE